MGSLWLVIAKQELRILTSRFRTHRKLVLVILASVLVAWGVLCSVIMPAIHGAPFNPALETQIGLLFAPIIELALFLLFIYFFIIPISATIQESESKQFDLIISPDLAVMLFDIGRHAVHGRFGTAHGYIQGLIIIRQPGLGLHRSGPAAGSLEKAEVFKRKHRAFPAGIVKAAVDDRR